MTNYTRLQAPTLHEIRFAKRLKKYLIIETNFNPFLFQDFANLIVKIEGVKKHVASEKYPDGTGYMIFELDNKNQYAYIACQLTVLFSDYFFEKYN